MTVTRKDVLPGFVTPDELRESLLELYDNGLPEGDSTGWPNIDKLYRVAPSQLTVVTGIPGHGKSEWLDAVMVNLALRKDWRFAVYSPENNPREMHIAKLVEKHIGKPFNRGPNQRMEKSELIESLKWLRMHFELIDPHRFDPVSVDEILDRCYDWAHIEQGLPCGVVIDPWNELEHERPDRWSETEYVSATLTKIRRFSRTTKCHVWIVAHPAKMLRDRDGKRPVPSPYDISGSAHWFNKADNCITVWRDVEAQEQSTEIHVQKIRFKWCGRVGLADLSYDRVTGRYSVPLKLASDSYRDASNGRQPGED